MKKIVTVMLAAFILGGCKRGYIKEGKNVYYIYSNAAVGTKKIKLNADAASFEKLNNYFGKDNKNVFYMGDIIPAADAPSFRILSKMYQKDKNKVYYSSGIKINGANASEFRLLENDYATDDHDVFYKGDPLHVASAKDFSFVFTDDEDEFGGRWTTDGRSYFFEDKRVPSDDYKNITLFKKCDGLAKDRQWVYFQNRKINFNGQGRKIIDTVDAASFTATGFGEGKDKSGCMNINDGRIPCK